jgi:hypothetical protein
VVDLSSKEENVALDTLWDEDITRKMFSYLNHCLLGPRDDDNIIVISDSEEEEDVHEDDRTDVDSTPLSLRDSPAPSTSATADDDVTDGVQDDSSDGGAPDRVQNDSSDDEDGAY